MTRVRDPNAHYQRKCANPPPDPEAGVAATRHSRGRQAGKRRTSSRDASSSSDDDGAAPDAASPWLIANDLDAAERDGLLQFAGVGEPRVVPARACNRLRARGLIEWRNNDDATCGWFVTQLGENVVLELGPAIEGEIDWSCDCDECEDDACEHALPLLLELGVEAIAPIEIAVHDDRGDATVEPEQRRIWWHYRPMVRTTSAGEIHESLEAARADAIANLRALRERIDLTLAREDARSSPTGERSEVQRG